MIQTKSPDHPMDPLPWGICQGNPSFSVVDLEFCHLELEIQVDRASD